MIQIFPRTTRGDAGGDGGDGEAATGGEARHREATGGDAHPRADEDVREELIRDLLLGSFRPALPL